LSSSTKQNNNNNNPLIVDFTPPLSTRTGKQLMEPQLDLLQKQLHSKEKHSKHMSTIVIIAILVVQPPKIEIQYQLIYR
jgi:hypothetical protein